MNNRFILNEDEKRNIRGLHGIGFIKEGLTEIETYDETQEQVDEDVEFKDSPGTNPEFFYDEDSIFAQIRRKEESEKLSNLEGDLEMNMSKEELNNKLIEIYSLLQDDATLEASGQLEDVLYKLGAFKN